MISSRPLPEHYVPGPTPMHHPAFSRNNSTSSDERLARTLQADYDSETYFIRLRQREGTWRPHPSPPAVPGPARPVPSPRPIVFAGPQDGQTGASYLRPPGQQFQRGVQQGCQQKKPVLVPSRAPPEAVEILLPQSGYATKSGYLVNNLVAPPNRHYAAPPQPTADWNGIRGGGGPQPPSGIKGTDSYDYNGHDLLRLAQEGLSAPKVPPPIDPPRAPRTPPVIPPLHAESRPAGLQDVPQRPRDPLHTRPLRAGPSPPVAAFHPRPQARSFQDWEAAVMQVGTPEKGKEAHAGVGRGQQVQREQRYDQQQGRSQDRQQVLGLTVPWQQQLQQKAPTEGQQQLPEARTSGQQAQLLADRGGMNSRGQSSIEGWQQQKVPTAPGVLAVQPLQVHTGLQTRERAVQEQQQVMAPRPKPTSAEYPVGSRITREMLGHQPDDGDADREAAIAVVMQELGLDSSPSFSKRSSSMRHRLAQTDPAPHVMRVNSSIKRTEQEELSEHDRVQRNLRQYALKEYPVSGDGNCQFRSLSHQLYGSDARYAEVRRAVVAQLKKYASRYSPYVPENYQDYVKHMAKSGIWGDHITLQAAADKYKAKVTLITSYKDKFVVEIMPREGRPCFEVWLSYYAEMHYNSVYPAELPLGSVGGKKSHWLLDVFSS